MQITYPASCLVFGRKVTLRFSKYAQHPSVARFLSSYMRNAYTIKSKKRSPTPSSFSEPQGRKNHH
ncbi:hypothetical protein OIU79_016155 [Salix purpurea]|uniref:Uncharacterized protein n=1 Tax=Salix purpurea TaxID=77065 RepID=A0A9Q0PE53_SALPP|nr:hypothetical protein OIU79_016155 [Salix purpurea]